MLDGRKGDVFDSFSSAEHESSARTGAAPPKPSRPRPPSPPSVTLSYCGSAPQATPDVVLVVCNTDDITAPGASATMNTSGFLGTPDRPLPPANHTVSLLC